jgi:hypothetical protein
MVMPANAADLHADDALIPALDDCREEDIATSRSIDIDLGFTGKPKAALAD